MPSTCARRGQLGLRAAAQHLAVGQLAHGPGDGGSGALAEIAIEPHHLGGHAVHRRHLRQALLVGIHRAEPRLQLLRQRVAQFVRQRRRPARTGRAASARPSLPSATTNWGRFRRSGTRTGDTSIQIGAVVAVVRCRAQCRRGRAVRQRVVARLGGEHSRPAPPATANAASQCGQCRQHGRLHPLSCQQIASSWCLRLAAQQRLGVAFQVVGQRAQGHSRARQFLQHAPRVLLQRRVGRQRAVGRRQRARRASCSAASTCGATSPLSWATSLSRGGHHRVHGGHRPCAGPARSARTAPCRSG